MSTLVAFVMVCAKLALVVGAFAMISAKAQAQLVYFEDEFEGSVLKPHWIQPPPEDWEHDVSGGFLNVTKLKYPSAPHTGYNQSTIKADLFTPTGDDWAVEVGFEWDASIPQSSRIFFFGLSGSKTNEPPDGLASVGYFDGGSVGLFTPGKVVGGTAPAQGYLTLAFARVDGILSFYVNGQNLGSTPDTSGKSAQSIYLDFQVTYPPGVVSPFHVDYVRVIPAPSVSAIALLGGVMLCSRRR